MVLGVLFHNQLTNNTNNTSQYNTLQYTPYKHYNTTLRRCRTVAAVAVLLRSCDCLRQWWTMELWKKKRSKQESGVEKLFAGPADCRVV